MSNSMKDAVIAKTAEEKENKEEKAQASIGNILKGLTPEQRKEAEAYLVNEKVKEEYALANKAKKKIIITDFYDARVNPFAGGVRLNGLAAKDGQAIYEIFSKKNTPTIMSGAKLQSFFGKDKEEIIAFEDKVTGPTHVLTYQGTTWFIKFLKYEIEE